MTTLDPEIDKVLADIAAKNDKLKRAKAALHQFGAKIPITEKLLADAKKMHKEYAEAEIRLTSDLLKYKRANEAALKYVSENEDDAEIAEKAAKLAKEIAKLQARVVNLTAQKDALEKDA